MGLEIEHKYLVKDGSYKGLSIESHRIMQGYLSRVPERTVRIRVRDQEGFITVKGINKGDCRTEFEYSIPHSDAIELLKLCEGKIIDKIRYIIPFEGFKWEVDEFHGCHEGLVIAEIELPASDTLYTRPDFVGANVTGDPRYYNSSLSF
jgi:adenylate cyclase